MNYFVATAFISEGAEGGFPTIGNFTFGKFDWVVFDQPNGTLGLKDATPRPQGDKQWLGDVFSNRGDWDIDFSQNWFDENGFATYSDGDRVLFSDETLNDKIDITEPVGPASIIFTNTDDPDSGTHFRFFGQPIRGFTNVDKLGNGTVSFFNSNTYKGTTNIVAGLMEFLAQQDIGDVNVHAGASLYFGVAQHLWGLHIEGSASVGVGRSNTIVAKGLEISDAGTLDLADNAMIIKVDPEDLAATVADVNAMIGRGLSTGSGLISTVGLANRRLGVISNKTPGGARYSNFFGETDLNGDEVLVLYTVIGDLNLDGSVTISDFIDLASNFNSAGGWQEGDLNYDGMVTISDFIDLASNFNQTYSGQTLPINPADMKMLADFAEAHGASVPEPALLALSLPSLLLVRRRRL
jgi:autotransporter-associated beta strand protein